MATNRDQDSKDISAPPRLIAALRQTQSARVFVPRAADEAVLRAAHEHLVPAQPGRWNPFAHWFRWPAFATACVLLCAVAYRLTRPASSSNPVQVFVREDVNHDGRVDILDAFQLARQLQTGEGSAAGLDLNGDGLVNRLDVEVIALHAVKLEKGGRS